MLRIYMFLKTFFRPTAPSKPIPPKEWLNTQFKASGLDKRFPQPLRDTTQKSVKIFYNQDYFAHNDTNAPFSLCRALTKIPAINVSGDRDGVFQNGISFPLVPDFFARIPLTHPELLSPTERLSAAKKIVFSNSSVFASGGTLQ